MPQIIHEKRNILSVAGYIQWSKETRQPPKAAFAYTVNEGKKVISQDAFPCEGIESVYQLELCAIQHALFLSIPPKIFVVIKATEPAVISGINTDMDVWAENDWITKNGSPVKNRDLWEYLYEEKQQRRMMALPLEETEVSKLRAISKTLVLQYP